MVFTTQTASSWRPDQNDCKMDQVARYKADIRRNRRMKAVAALCVLVMIASCRAENESNKAFSSVPPTSRVASGATSTPALKKFLTPGLPATDEDSVIDALFAGQSTVSRNGDTLANIGEGMLDDAYSASWYRQNAGQHVRIVHLLGRRPDGSRIWSTRARLSLPPMDSTQQFMFAGMCGRGGKGDPYILAIAVVNDDSVYRDIRHAWEFDPATETVREIPTAHVFCWNQGGD
jgi:hypothetical protein